jgi:hypothetical protein
MPATYAVRTPSGGRHYYFKGSAPTSAGRLAPGVDVRARGGYVLIPPSVVNGVTYTDENDLFPADPPAWLLDLIQTPKHEAITVGADELDRPEDLQRARAWLAHQPPAKEGEGGDDYTLRVINWIYDLGVSPERAAEVLADWNARCEPPWPEDELAQKIENAARYRQNAFGVHALGTTSEEAFGEFVKTLAPEVVQGQGAGRYPKPLSGRELSTGHFPRAKFMINDFLLSGRLNLLYGDGAAGKTALALHMAVAVAAGLPFFGRQVQQAPALVVLAEDDEGETKGRLTDICASFGVALGDIPLLTWALPGHDLILANIAEDGSWRPGPFWEPLREQVAALGTGFLLLDTVTDFASLDETKRLPVNTLCKAVLGSLCKDFGATILVNAHPSKTAMADGTMYAGSTAWNNSVRNRLTLERPDKGSPRRVLKVAKSNYGADAELELFMRGPVYTSHQDGTEAKDRCFEACVEAALKAAEHHAPFQKQRHVPGWAVEEIERACGFRPNQRQVKEHLATAIVRRRLRYMDRTNDRVAGYYPWNEEVSKDLARAAKLHGKRETGHAN